MCLDSKIRIYVLKQLNGNQSRHREDNTDDANSENDTWKNRDRGRNKVK